jgi:hypothetical protein
VVPGLKCRVVLVASERPNAPPTVAVFNSDEITCKPDETRDLGDLKARPRK